MSDIFISYARSTVAQAEQIAAALRELGYDVWRDDELPAHRAYSDVIEAELAAAKAVLALDPQNVDVLFARYFVIAPFGRFLEADAALQRLRQAPGMGDGEKYIGWSLRNFGHVRAIPT